MNTATPSTPKSEVLHLLATYWRRWLATACLVTAAAGVYALMAKPSWLASQTLILRNEATNNDTGPGKFNRSEELKSLEETLLELAKSQGVLEGALGQVGPPADYASEESWPGPRSIDAVRRLVTLVPPKGVEFGTAEIFHLEVRDSDHDRAVRLNRAVCDQLQARFQEIRDAKAQSMIEELSKTVRLAKADLDETTSRLSAIEKRLGCDLAELRGMHDAASGDSALRRSAAEIDGDLRHTRAAQQVNRQLLAMLQTSVSDPKGVLAMPSRLLESQPALKRLKDGLVDAQLRTSQLKGRMSPEHPLVIAARIAEDEVAGHLHDELSVVAGSLEAELRLDSRRIALLEAQLGEATGRLGRLAELRAAYANLVAETGHRTKLVERAEQNMAEARAARAGAMAASLISRVDAPDAGIRPVSPSPMTILLGGILGGLAAGLGMVMLTVSPRRSGELPLTTVEAKSGGLSQFSFDENGTVPFGNPVPAGARPALPCTTAAHGNLSLRQALEKAMNGGASLPAAMRP
ncbi:MAG: hypothetical protein ABR915_15175 [Thermoguttaceae bacterium]|jgi:uncharacterized protein involved in exopolysaccharide biosynthesis